MFTFSFCCFSRIKNLFQVYIVRWHCLLCADTVQKAEKYALTAVTFIHSDCYTINIQKADMCSELGPLGPWQVINQ